MPSWPHEEETHSSKERKRDEKQNESDDDESDSDEDWIPEQYQVESNPIPAEATIRRPISYLVFRNEDGGFLMNSLFMPFLKKKGAATPLKVAVMKNIKENRRTPGIALLLESFSFLVRVSVLRSSVPVYRDIRVPSNMNLRMFQSRVLCPVFDWDSKQFPEKYIYYLPNTRYPSQRRPLSTFKDIVFTVPYQHDSFDQLVTRNYDATEAQVIDDSDVCLADFMQEVGHTLYYQHNLSLSVPITLQLKVLQLNQEESVELIEGVGISPPEDNLITEGPWEQTIVGIDAFNLAIKWLQSPKIDKSYQKEGMRLLEIKDIVAFDPAKFDLPGAREKLQHSLQHATAKTRLPSAARHAMTMLLIGDPARRGVPLPVVHSLGMCKTCLKENVKLLTCGRCKSVYYCSKECQKKDWKSHKAVCSSC